MSTRMRTCGKAVLMAGVTCALSAVSGLSQAQTRWYVIGMFHLATYSDGHFGAGSNCPKGGNGSWADEALRILKNRYHYSDGKAKQVFLAQRFDLAGKAAKKSSKAAGTNTDDDFAGFPPSPLTDRGIHDGKPVSAYEYPLSVPEGTDEIVVPHGRGYGFDLDGRGSQRADSLEDPETHDKGVENNLFRAMGCYALYNVNLPVRPTYDESVFIDGLAIVPAWLMSISGDHLDADGDVTVSFAKALEHPLVGPNGKAMGGATYTLDPSPRNFGTLKGHISNGILVAVGDQVVLEEESPLITELNLTRTQLRLSMKTEGTIGGYLGGFEPWRDYWFFSGFGEAEEGLDISTFYYHLRELADADPDPKTGKNRRISATYRLDDLAPVYVMEAPTYRPPRNLRSLNTVSAGDDRAPLRAHP